MSSSRASGKDPRAGPRAPVADGPGPAPSLVLGTAGHIDHGKTALVAALTGVDTDRLPEEKARGITIALGFAPLDLPGGLRLGVVDVPGHERLVRTMVSGATGIDLVLLVVAADEGVMPQTREHVAICDLLGIRRGVVALTKIDTCSADVVELAREEVCELLAPTGLAAAPIFPVAAPLGEGLDALRAGLAEAAREADAASPRTGPPRLPIDRVFAMRGFGTVVTGTLIGGALHVGDAVEIFPEGGRARVRGLQSHGAPVERAAPGIRCAVNVQGVESDALQRGRVLSAPDALAPTRTLDAALRWLPGSPPLRESTSLKVLAGTSERLATVAPVGVPGEAVRFVRLHLEGDALALLPGDRFVLRGFTRTASGGFTLGGGVVLDVAPPRRRRSDPALASELAELEGGDAGAGVGVRIRRAGLAGVAREALRRETGLAPEALAAHLEKLSASGAATSTSQQVWLCAQALAELRERLHAALEAFHAAEPLRPGMARGALRGRLPENVPDDAADLALATLADDGTVRIAGDRVSLASHAPELSADDRTLADRLCQEARAAGLEPPGLREWSERLGAPPQRLRELLAHLEREGALVHAPGDLWFDRAAVDGLRARVVDHLRSHGSLDTRAYKALIGTTRKWAVPLMELFDAEHVTLRRGEQRILRGSGS